MPHVGGAWDPRGEARTREGDAWTRRGDAGIRGGEAWIREGDAGFREGAARYRPSPGETPGTFRLDARVSG